MNYDADYYERGEELGISGYTAYTWLAERTIPLAHELVTQLGIKKHHKILDYGCAKGYLVKALRLLHYDAVGVDISEYAIAAAPEDIRANVRLIRSEDDLGGPYDWVIAKDVLEHLSPYDLGKALAKIRARAKNLFVVVPLGDGKKYVIEAYEHDVTHIIREDLGWWTHAFSSMGFEVEEARYHMPHIKDNWAQYTCGNGFFVLS